MKARHTLLHVVIFSIAMGYLEAAVVVYLREIYYPEGFLFPLKLLSTRDVMAELGRELATLVMLVMIGIISGKTKIQRFAFFLLAFGVWDIAYYLVLWLTLGWPPSLFTWDILFLLPVIWVGPVLAPCILSATMILCAILMLNREKVGQFRLSPRILTCLIAGALVVIASFCEDPIRHWHAFNGGNLNYSPSHFLWALFLAGEVIILAGIYQIYLAKRK